MMLTEEQAREKWCPFARFQIFTARIQTSSGNRVGHDRGEELNPKQCRCIASDCMAWRMGPFETELGDEMPLPSGQTPAGFVDYDAVDEEGWRWTTTSSTLSSKIKWTRWRAIARRGYCGLAGAMQP